MKTNKIIFTAVLGLTLCIAPAFAQRGGGHSSSGGSRSGGSSHSSSSHSSYSGGSSRSSSSSSHSSYSGSRSSSSSHSSYSGSRSSSSYSGSRSSSSSSGYRSGTAHVGRSGEGSSNSRSNHVSSSRSERQPMSSSPRSTAVSGRGSDHSRTAVSGRGGDHGSRAGVRDASKGGGRTTYADQGTRHSTYARPGHPGAMPPSARPMHPAPYFHHPIHHHMIHCHSIYWDPCCIHHHHWPGFWCYCNNYWYDYHTTDVIVVREYVHQNYGVEMLDYVISGEYMYALIVDPDGQTYLQVFDQSDKLIAEQQVHKKYRKIELDRDNGGCWIMKKGDKDPLLFIYTEGQLLIYEAD